MSWLERLWGKDDEENSDSVSDINADELKFPDAETDMPVKLKDAELSDSDSRTFDPSSMDMKEYSLESHMQEMPSEEIHENADDITRDEQPQNAYHWMEDASDDHFAEEEAEWKRNLQERLKDQSPERQEELREKYPEFFDEDDGSDDNPAVKKLTLSRARHR